jgi:hypothetical protein
MFNTSMKDMISRQISSIQIITLVARVRRRGDRPPSLNGCVYLSGKYRETRNSCLFISGKNRMGVAT